jgi:tetratricopeptide (TPR) repeat protein
VSFVAILALAAVASASPAPTAAPPVRVLVVPPEPVTEAGTPWIAEVVADVLPRDLDRLGVSVVDRVDRLRAHDALDVPPVALTRATSIRLAEALGVSRIVSGTYELRGHDVTVSLRWLDLDRGTLSPPLIGSAPLDNLQSLLHGLAWDIGLAGPWKPETTREVFLAAVRRVVFPAFENYGKGLSAAKAGQRIEHLRTALKLQPDYDEARVALARLEIEAREHGAAHATLAAVPETSSLSRAARYLQGVALLEMARYDDARAVYLRLAETSVSPGVLSNHALAVLRAGEAGTASGLLRQAVAAAPGVTDVAFNLGWSLLVEGDSEAAVFWLRGVTRQAPRDLFARVALSWALRKAGHLEEAAEEWRGVSLIGPPDGVTDAPDLERRLGRIQFAEWPLAIERSDVEQAVAHVGRADALLKANDVDGALRELTRAAYLDPYSPRAHELMARAHLARGEREKAINELQMSLWCRDDPDVRLQLARVLADLGRTTEAQAEAAKVLKSDPDNEAARVLSRKSPGT